MTLFFPGKNYSSIEEEKFRMKIFMENKQRIAKHNSRFHLGHHAYKLKMNHYGDLLPYEFQQQMNGYRHDLKKSSNLLGASFIAPANVEYPESVDWRTLGAVTPIKDQGQCGSCWAFSATGSLEGQHFRQTGKLVSLSEQNLVDCVDGSHGCGGGFENLAFKYIKDNGGIDTEESYLYEARDNKGCRYRKKDVGATDIGFVDIPHGDEDALKAALATVGPVSVAIDSSGGDLFQFYSEGVYNEPKCSSEKLDHGVLVVGYGVEDNGEEYWLVKNSFGTGWGEKGYIKMARNKKNACGIATQASYPVV